MAKKNIPWTEIKTKYLMGILPIDIYNEYSSFLKSAKQISDKAYREKWKQDKSNISEEISESIKECVKENELKRNEKILKINDLAIDACSEYFENSDYKRCLVETTEPYKNADGDLVFDPKGRPIMIKSVQIVDIPFVNAPILKQAIESLAKANETSRKNEGLDKPSGGSQVENPLTLQDISNNKNAISSLLMGGDDAKPSD